MKHEDSLERLKASAQRGVSRSQYRVSVSPGAIMRLFRLYEDLAGEHARCIKPPPPRSKDSRPVIEL